MKRGRTAVGLLAAALFLGAGRARAQGVVAYLGLQLATGGETRP